MADKSFANSEYIFREGESAAYAYVIKSGAVEITKHSADGEQVLAELVAPTIFGEMALIDGNPRSAGARAKENTVVTIVRRYMAPLSTVEDGSAEERKGLWDEWFENITMENDKLLSQKILRHYWSGTYNPRKETPIIFIREFASMADADDGGWDEPIEAFWPDEEQRKERLAQGNKYWLGRHEDIGIYRNLVNLQK